MSSLNGEIIACGQRTGGDIPLHIYGDEFYARYETVDGYTVVYDSDLGRPWTPGDWTRHRNSSGCNANR